MNRCALADCPCCLRDVRSSCVGNRTLEDERARSPRLLTSPSSFAACDDEERIGHVLRRIAALSSRASAARPRSSSPTKARATTPWRSPSCSAPRCARSRSCTPTPGMGFRDACQRARGRAIVLYDARTDAPLGAVGFALGRLRDGARRGGGRRPLSGDPAHPRLARVRRARRPARSACRRAAFLRRARGSSGSTCA